MAKKGFLGTLLFLFTLLEFRAAAQPFQKVYTSSSSQLFVAQDLTADTAQQCYVTGEWWRDRPQAFLMKTDLNGSPVWCRTFRPTDTAALLPMGLSIGKTSDNSLVVSALKEKSGEVLGGVLLKTSSAGALEWSKFAPCVWRSSKVCTDDGHAYYAATGKGTRKVYLCKIANDGQVLWERLLEAGAMDLYSVESFVITGNGGVILSLKVAKFYSGGVGPEHTILFRLDAAGAVQQVAYFPFMHIAALQPYSGGRIAFRCSANDVTWTGIGMMDTDFNWLWFKKSRLASMVLLPNILNREAAKSGDETRLFGLFYTPGGEKIALSFDTGGNLMGEQVYFSAPYSEKAVAAGAEGYVRSSGIRADAFILTKTEGGDTVPGCFFLQPCGLILEDTLIAASSINWAATATVCLQPEPVTVTDMPLQADDYCFEPGAINASFSVSDTVICTGGAIEFQRNAGNSGIPFGLSEWRLPGGFPASATGPAVKNVRFNQSGSYSISHVFNVAGCADTAFATITVLPPPELLLGADTILCDGDTMQLRAGVNLNHFYQWNTGDTDALVTAYTAGTYSVTVTNAGGCTNTAAVSVALLSAQTVRLGNDTVLCRGETLRIQPAKAVPGSAFHWNTGETKPHLDVPGPGTYSLTASSAGCAFTDTIVVEMADCAECQVYVPTVFAPGRGGLNGVFQVFPGCPFSDVRLRVYDRWGNLVYADTGQVGWDGTFKGKPLPPGVYVYYAEIELLAGDKPGGTKRKTGDVTLIR